MSNFNDSDYDDWSCFENPDVDEIYKNIKVEHLLMLQKKMDEIIERSKVIQELIEKRLEELK